MVSGCICGEDKVLAMGKSSKRRSIFLVLRSTSVRGSVHPSVGPLIGWSVGR